LHGAVRDVEDEHVRNPVLRVAQGGPRLTVDEAALDVDPGLGDLATESGKEPGHAIDADDRGRPLLVSASSACAAGSSSGPPTSGSGSHCATYDSRRARAERS
jgi:hypothetical protein